MPVGKGMRVLERKKDNRREGCPPVFSKIKFPVAQVDHLRGLPAEQVGPAERDLVILWVRMCV